MKTKVIVIIMYVILVFTLISCSNTNLNEEIDNQITITDVCYDDYIEAISKGNPILKKQVMENDSKEKEQYETNLLVRMDNVKLEEVQYAYKKIEKIEVMPENTSFKTKLADYVQIAKFNSIEEIVSVNSKGISSIETDELHKYEWIELSTNVDYINNDTNSDNQKYPINSVRISLSGYFEVINNHKISNLNGFMFDREINNNKRYRSKDILKIIVNYKPNTI